MTTTLRRHCRLLTVVAAVVGLTSGNAAALPVTAETAAAPPAHSVVARPVTAPAGVDPQALSLPGATKPSYTITLVTGDEVTLAASGERYSVTTESARRADGSRPAIQVDARTDRHGRVTSMTATPVDVEGAVRAGVVDPALFDVDWLIDRAERGQRALPVTLHLDVAGAADLRRQAADLPGATVQQVHPTSRTVDVEVAPRRAADFWAAVAPGLRFGDGAAYVLDGREPRLAAGVREVWPTGRRTPTQPLVDTEEPTRTVTMTITKKIGDPFYCIGASARVWVLCTGLPDLVRLDGRFPGTVYPVAEGRCVEQETCSVMELVYEVPDGKYSSQGLGIFRLDNRTQFLDLIIPELEVDGDTTIRYDGDRATQATVDAPRPSEQYDGVWASFRTFADGRGGSTSLHTAWGYSNYWAVPSSRVTVGSFHLSQVWMLGKPLVSMNVTEPSRLRLHPVMPGYEHAAPGKEIARFTGDREVELVDAGLGRAEDFAGIDARGKLVLMQLDVGAGDGVDCDMREAPLLRAEAAGAVGVVVDPFATNGPFPERECDLPVLTAAWSPTPREVPDLPYAAVPRREAQRLRDLLGRGEVRIDLAGYAGVSPYAYLLSVYQQGRVPPTLRTRLTARDLQEEDSRYHGPSRSSAELTFSAWNPLETVVGGLIYEGLTEPARFTVSRGPVAPDVVWRQWHDSAAHSATTLDVVDRAGPRDLRWNAAPAAPGTARLPGQVFAAQPGKWEDGWAVELCTFCREGDVFYPTFLMVTGAAPATSSPLHAFAPEKVRLLADGEELPQGEHFYYGPTYELPRRPTTYRLTGQTATTRTTWTFRSARDKQARAPRGRLCPSFFSDPAGGCQVEPLLLLRYRIGTDLRDAVPAGARRTLVVSAYRPLGRAAKVAGIRVLVSADGGQTWKRLATRSLGRGEYAARFRVPALRRTDGALAFRVSARAPDGSTIRQTIRQAVAVKRAR